MSVFSSRIGVGYIKAAADYTTNQFYAVKLDSNGNFELADTLGEFIDGVICEPAVLGDALGVTISGIEKGVASAAILAGADLAIAADGRFVTAGSGHAIVGRAQSAASAAGELVSVLLGYKGVAP